jgi:hypothetical protein
MPAAHERCEVRSGGVNDAILRAVDEALLDERVAVYGRAGCAPVAHLARAAVRDWLGELPGEELAQRLIGGVAAHELPFRSGALAWQRAPIRQ